MKQEKLVKKFNKALDRMTLELRGNRFEDEELKEIGERVNRFVKELYSRRSQSSRAAQHAFTEALSTLRQLRNIPSK